MKIKTNVKDVIKSLEEASEEIERKLKNMVAGFAKEVSVAASDNTPKGSQWRIENDAGYRNLYLERESEWGIPAEPGYHSGAWKYAEGTQSFSPMIFTKQEMAANVLRDASVSYQLGDSFSIEATGPGYAKLEKGYSHQQPDGIMKPTTEHIMTAHQSQLKKYFDEG